MWQFHKISFGWTWTTLLLEAQFYYDGNVAALFIQSALSDGFKGFP